MAVARSSGSRCQVNVPLEDEHWYLVLQQLVIREGSSIPEVLRPVILAFLKRKVDRDPDLADAVSSIEKSRASALDRLQRRKKLAPVTDLTFTQRGTEVRGSKPNHAKRTSRSPSSD